MSSIVNAPNRMTSGDAALDHPPVHLGSAGSPIIGLSPYLLSNTAFVEGTSDVLRRIGRVVEVPHTMRLLGEILSGLLKLRNARKPYDVLILARPKGLTTFHEDRLTLRGRLEYLLFIHLGRLAARQLVYVRDIDAPSGKDWESREHASKLVAKAESLADVVVTHSPLRSAEAKLAYVPYPLREQAGTPFGDTAVLSGWRAVLKPRQAAIPTDDFIDAVVTQIDDEYVVTLVAVECLVCLRTPDLRKQVRHMIVKPDGPAITLKMLHLVGIRIVTAVRIVSFEVTFDPRTVDEQIISIS